MSRRCCSCRFCANTGGNDPSTLSARVSFSGFGVAPGCAKWQQLNGTSWDIPFGYQLTYPTCYWFWGTLFSGSIDQNNGGACNFSLPQTDGVSLVASVDAVSGIIKIGVTSGWCSAAAGTLIFNSSDCGVTFAQNDAIHPGLYCNGAANGGQAAIAFV